MSEHPTADGLENELVTQPSYNVARDAIAALRAAEEDAEVGRLLRELTDVVGGMQLHTSKEMSASVFDGFHYYFRDTPLAALRALKEAVER